MLLPVLSVHINEEHGSGACRRNSLCTEAGVALSATGPNTRVRTSQHPRVLRPYTVHLYFGSEGLPTMLPRTLVSSAAAAPPRSSLRSCAAAASISSLGGSADSAAQKDRFRRVLTLLRILCSVAVIHDLMAASLVPGDATAKM